MPDWWWLSRRVKFLSSLPFPTFLISGFLFISFHNFYHVFAFFFFPFFKQNNFVFILVKRKENALLVVYSSRREQLHKQI